MARAKTQTKKPRAAAQADNPVKPTKAPSARMGIPPVTSVEVAGLEAYTKVGAMVGKIYAGQIAQATKQVEAQKKALTKVKDKLAAAKLKAAGKGVAAAKAKEAARLLGTEAKHLAEALTFAKGELVSAQANAKKNDAFIKAIVKLEKDLAKAEARKAKAATKTKRGRQQAAAAERPETSEAKRGPGRPKKVAVEKGGAEPAPAKKPGRPKKASVAVEVAASTPRKPGRPKKGVETTSPVATPAKAAKPKRAKVAEPASGKPVRKPGRPKKAPIAEVVAEPVPTPSAEPAGEVVDE